MFAGMIEELPFTVLQTCLSVQTSEPIIAKFMNAYINFIAFFAWIAPKVRHNLQKVEINIQFIKATVLNVPSIDYP